jgi:hypothetical protein
MEDAGGQFGSMPEVNPTIEATANDVVQNALQQKRAVETFL